MKFLRAKGRNMLKLKLILMLFVVIVFFGNNCTLQAQIMHNKDAKINVYTGTTLVTTNTHVKNTGTTFVKTYGNAQMRIGKDYRNYSGKIRLNDNSKIIIGENFSNWDNVLNNDNSSIYVYGFITNTGFILNMKYIIIGL